jgi:hypothetical protein
MVPKDHPLAKTVTLVEDDLKCPNDIPWNFSRGEIHEPNNHKGERNGRRSLQSPFTPTKSYL